jgi:hypothetical protein
MSVILISQTQRTTQALHGILLSHLIFSLSVRYLLVELWKERMQYIDRRHSAHDISLRPRRSITIPGAVKLSAGSAWTLAWLWEGIARSPEIRSTSTRRCIGF